MKHRVGLLVAAILAGTLACAAIPRDCEPRPPLAVKCYWGNA